jgi:hypothetical protein
VRTSVIIREKARKGYKAPSHDPTAECLDQTASYLSLAAASWLEDGEVHDATDVQQLQLQARYHWTSARLEALRKRPADCAAHLETCAAMCAAAARVAAVGGEEEPAEVVLKLPYLVCDAEISRAAVAGKVWGTQLHRALQEAPEMLRTGRHAEILDTLLPHAQRLLAQEEATKPTPATTDQQPQPNPNAGASSSSSPSHLLGLSEEQEELMMRVVHECTVAVGGGSQLVLALRCCAALGRRLLARTLAARQSDAMAPAHSTAVVNVLYWAQQILDGELGRAMPVGVYNATAAVGPGTHQETGHCRAYSCITDSTYVSLPTVGCRD